MPLTRDDSTASVEAVLRNQELLMLIFGYFLPLDPTRLEKDGLLKGRRQLLKLALTCKAFQEPAMSCLWSCLESLTPLMKLLPNLQIMNNAYYFYGALPEDCAFRRYGRRVRVLNLQDRRPGTAVPDNGDPVAPPPTISSETYVLIARELKGGSMLPALRRVYLDSPGEAPSADFAALPALLSSSVEALILSGTGLGNAVFSSYYFPMASHHLQSLKYLSLHTASASLKPATFDTILELRSLETLDLRLPQSVDLPPQKLFDLTRNLTCLKSLTLDVHFAAHRVSHAFYRYSASEIGFAPPRLEKLHLFSRAHNTICGCLPAFLLEQLTHLTLIISDPSFRTEGHFQSLVTTLSQIPTFKALIIESVPRPPPNHFAPPRRALAIGWNAVRLLLAELSLTELEVDIPINYGESGGLLPILQDAFTPRPDGPPRKLKKLGLPPIVGSGRYYDNTAPALSLMDLCEVANHAHGLEHLAFVLRVGSVDDIARMLSEAKNAGNKSQSVLRTLRIWDVKNAILPAKGCRMLAELLDLLFPTLESIQPYAASHASSPGAYWSAYWEDIEELRQTYRTLRIYRTS
ncbi:hypothetical protein DFP72DRAFT_1146034 [Ephemerocybe angulata]|uniref:F-box domain-containing protein n=1 Tax=Ephemerocybe angulata TaxID=980116 RepID=A0A8H6M055_9AGAR|nr:hypothetical protein DFP72DRAFT_1146034 [Tulosesus angulatus]